ncbi:MAG TPA: hypothetical protein DD733_01445 [Clostridiales bacterium]|nr:hypothetical protein [Clostridiales bacterium]
MIEKKQYKDCGVCEEDFPSIGKCGRKKEGSFALYEKICPYCYISVYLPQGVNLKTVTIFECSRLGYGKRET